MYHPKMSKHAQTTTTVKLEQTKEKCIARSKKGHKIIEFPLRTAFKIISYNGKSRRTKEKKHRLQKF